MITLQRPDPTICILIGNKSRIRQGDMVRPSQFAIRFYLGDRKVIYNTLTGHCIESKYWDWFENGTERAFDENDAEMKALVKRDFLVSPNIDEATRYGQLIKVARRMDRPKHGYTGYSILPTTACNARCFYCYEEGMAYETMSDEIVEQTIRYIHATRLEDAPIHLGWFGGEPLIGEKIIDRICAATRDANVSYSSDMITNGSLMTEEMAKKARADWHLRKVQITLDGREKVYCERKNYVSFKGSPYHAVLEAIHALTGQNINVSIRLNVDEDNADDLIALIDELEIEFKSERGISIYCHSIFADENEDVASDSALLYEKMERLNERLHAFNQKHSLKNKTHGFYSQKFTDDLDLETEVKEGKDRKRETTLYDHRGLVKRYYCMADNPDAGGVIMPNGDILLCEHISAAPVVGSVFDETIIQRENHFERGRERDERCAVCSLLPVCTDYMSCPTCTRDCVKENMAVEKRKLMWLSDEKRLPPITIDIDGEIIRVVEPTPEFAEKCTPLLADVLVKAGVTLTMEEASEKFVNL